MYEIFVLIILPTISNKTYSEVDNKAYKANKETNNKTSNRAYKANKGINNRASNKASKTVRAIRANKGVIIINSGLNYIAASYITFATISIIIFINIFSAKGLGFSLTG